MKVKVKRVTQSPMNDKRWCLELACGHELWVGAARRVTTKEVDCGLCEAPRLQKLRAARNWGR
jgi:hypothetical protein